MKKPTWILAQIIWSRGRPVEFLDASPRAEDLADTKKFG